jgi:hypothetical protein
MTRTLEEIRAMGLEALRERLGRAGMIRFLQQFETGKGDYARERHRWLDRTSLEQIVAKTKSKRGKKSKEL